MKYLQCNIPVVAYWGIGKNWSLQLCFANTALGPGDGSCPGTQRFPDVQLLPSDIWYSLTNLHLPRAGTGDSCGNCAVTARDQIASITLGDMQLANRSAMRTTEKHWLWSCFWNLHLFLTIGERKIKKKKILPQRRLIPAEQGSQSELTGPILPFH